MRFAICDSPYGLAICRAKVGNQSLLAPPPPKFFLSPLTTIEDPSILRSCATKLRIQQFRLSLTRHLRYNYLHYQYFRKEDEASRGDGSARSPTVPRESSVKISCVHVAKLLRAGGVITGEGFREKCPVRSMLLGGRVGSGRVRSGILNVWG